jgi:hypothetical protein
MGSWGSGLLQGRERKPRPQAHFDFVRGAPELDGSHYDAPLYSSVERLLAQAGESRAATELNYFAYNFIKIHRTLRTSPAMAAGGRWCHGSTVERRRLGGPLGSLRATEGGKSGINEVGISH